MCSRCVIWVSCSVHILRAQRIIGFFYLHYPQINEARSHMVGNQARHRGEGKGALIKMWRRL